VAPEPPRVGDITTEAGTFDRAFYRRSTSMPGTMRRRLALGTRPGPDDVAHLVSFRLRERARRCGAEAPSGAAAMAAELPP
jgi:hypothetical protein